LSLSDTLPIWRWEYNIKPDVRELVGEVRIVTALAVVQSSGSAVGWLPLRKKKYRGLFEIDYLLSCSSIIYSSYHLKWNAYLEFPFY
jgi:hypothetical protein